MSVLLQRIKALDQGRHHLLQIVTAVCQQLLVLLDAFLLGQREQDGDKQDKKRDPNNYATLGDAPRVAGMTI
ncbi:hypothetical protein E05_23960 [Plautia stali symbiont]|nr:hypothetical protein E05_23960 [Plautia stali symbiont]